MGLFDKLFGPKPAPVVNDLRDTLFGDLPIGAWPPSDLTESPWTTFIAARNDLAAGNTATAVEKWLSITQLPDLESRHYVQAWNFLLQHGQTPPPEIAKTVYGVVVEVEMNGGLDLLAAYSDHSARYYNYSGAGVVWEHPDDSLDGPIDALLAEAANVVAMIGPWDEPRRKTLTRGYVRLSFLTPSGLHFGEGPMVDMSRTGPGVAAMARATQLMQALIAKSGR